MHGIGLHQSATVNPQAHRLSAFYVHTMEGKVEEVLTLPGIFHTESIWNGWSPTPFHGLHMDYFLAGNAAIFSFHTHYGVHMDSIWNGPLHGHSMH